MNLVVLTIGHAEIWQGLYRAGFVYDVVWILPFAFYPWAAAAAPASTQVDAEEADPAATRSRPWVVFGALGLTPLLDFGLRSALPLGPLEGYRDLFTAITILSVFPLLMARLAVEHGQARQADGKWRLLSTAIEQADDLILITTPHGRVEHANGAFCRGLGYDPTEVVRMTSGDFLADESRSQLEAVAESVRASGVWRGTMVRCRKDKTAFLASSAVVALSDHQGRMTHFVDVGRDITRHRG